MTGTCVEGRVVRSIGQDTFADITTVPLVVPEGIDPNGLLFAGTLTDIEVGEVWERMTSRDDADQASRAALRALRDAVIGSDPVSAALVGAINYQLGEGP